MGTGSGKTFRAVMLIKELQGELGMDSKAVFLVNSMALMEQEAASIRLSPAKKMTLVLDMIVESGQYDIAAEWSQVLSNTLCLIRLNFASGKGRFIISQDTW